MATGEGSPSGRVLEQGPDWFLVSTEACGGGTPDLGYFLEVSVFIRNFWHRSHVKKVPESSTRQGPTPRGVGAPPTLVGSPGLSWPNSFTLGLLLVHKKSSKNWHVNWPPFGIPFL